MSMAEQLRGGSGLPRMPAIFINHGGGPMPLLGKQPAVSNFLSSYGAALPRAPKAVVVVTAHWETHVTTISCAERHSLLFDYGGFPQEAYQYTYHAPGSPSVAERVCELLEHAGLPHARDMRRGWDHGVFVPMMLMFPAADVPIVQVSLTSDQDTTRQLAVGAALQPLREEGVLIVGSGASFHNFRYFFARDSNTRAAGVAHSRIFDKWLTSTMQDPRDRAAKLVTWHTAPSANEAHPPGATEHLLPALVVAGAAYDDERAVKLGDAANTAEGDLGIAISQFEFCDNAQEVPQIP